MSKQEYNETLKRFKKAMEWYHSKQNEELQEKYMSNFEQLLEKLRTGCLELQANDNEIYGGFNGL